MNKEKSIVIVSGSLTAVGAMEIDKYSRDAKIPCSIFAVDDPDLPALLDSESSNVIYRIGPKSFDLYMHKLLPLLSNTEVIDALSNVITAFDKTHSSIIMQKCDIPTPATDILDKSSDLEDLLLPIVIKVGIGNQGVGVHLISSRQELKNVVRDILKTDNSCIAQEYLKESKGKDKRLFVVGNKVVAAMERSSDSDDFRANIHLGGSAKKYIPTNLESILALKATEAHGLLYAGVDIIDSERGPLILEVNPSPGFAISRISGVDVVAKLVAELIRSK